MAGKYVNQNVTIGNVRISYPHLLTPHAFGDNGEKKYQVTVIIPKNHPEVKKLIDAYNSVYERAVTELWDGRRPQQPHPAIQDGDKPNSSGAAWGPAFANSWIITPKARVKNAPTLRKFENGQPVPVGPAEVEEVFYAGCYCVIDLQFYAIANRNGNGVYSTLNGVCFLHDGERLAENREVSDDTFQAYAQYAQNAQYASAGQSTAPAANPFVAQAAPAANPFAAQQTQGGFTPQNNPFMAQTAAPDTDELPFN